MTMPSDEVKMAILVNADLGMTIGKTAAQVAHAAGYCVDHMRTWAMSTNDYLNILHEWEDNGTKKVVLRVDSDAELRKYLPEGEIGSKMITENPDEIITIKPVEDLGLTEIPRDSLTCIGIGPAHASVLDKYLRKLDSL